MRRVRIINDKFIFVFLGLCVLGVRLESPNTTQSSAVETSTDNRTTDELMDISDLSIYYSLETNQTIRKMMPRPWYRPGWPLRLPFYGGPCNCEAAKCVCCTGIRMKRLKFERELCTTLIYEGTESTVNMEVAMNGENIYRNSFSAKNPPPFCAPLPVPYLPPGLVDMCLRMYDISIVEQRLHVCMDVDTRIDMATVLILHFDCMNMGLDGVSVTKPGGGQLQTSSNTTSSVIGTDTAEPTQVNSDVFDPVTESENIPTTESPFKNAIKYI